MLVCARSRSNHYGLDTLRNEGLLYNMPVLQTSFRPQVLRKLCQLSRFGQPCSMMCSGAMRDTSRRRASSSALTTATSLSTEASPGPADVRGTEVRGAGVPDAFFSQIRRNAYVQTRCLLSFRRVRPWLDTRVSLGMVFCGAFVGDMPV